MTVPEVRWRKASISGEQTACVEVANTRMAVRDSKNPGGPVLAADIGPLLTAARGGRLDR